MNRHLIETLLGLVLAFGLVAQAHAQSSAPPSSTAQQAPSTQAPQGEAPKDATPPATQSPETKQPPQDGKQSPDAKVGSRSESGTSGGGRGGFLGVDPTVAMIIGAVLVIVIVIALVAMTRRSEDAPSRRSV